MPSSVATLIRAGANVNAANRYEMTPLALAAVNGDAAIITALLDAGADPNFARADGETVLMAAARTGRPEAVKALLARGARVDAAEKALGQTALMWAASGESRRRGQGARRGRGRRQQALRGAHVPAVQVGRQRHGVHRAAEGRLDAADVRGASELGGGRARARGGRRGRQRGRSRRSDAAPDRPRQRPLRHGRCAARSEGRSQPGRHVGAGAAVRRGGNAYAGADGGPPVAEAVRGSGSAGDRHEAARSSAPTRTPPSSGPRSAATTIWAATPRWATAPRR